MSPCSLGVIIAITLAACYGETPAAQEVQTYDYLKLSYKQIRSGNLCGELEFNAAIQNGIITLSSNTGSLQIRNELEDDIPELIAGDFWGNSRCFVGIMNARSDVNESYELYEVTSTTPPRKITSISSIINPDFANGMVISSYRDAARWHKENLCHPAGESPYVCAKSYSIGDTMEHLRQCASDGTCGPAKLALTSSGLPPTATVSQDIAFIFIPDTSGEMKQQRSYLVSGDHLNLLDYIDSVDREYFMFEYRGKRTTVGWIDAPAITLNQDD